MDFSSNRGEGQAPLDKSDRFPEEGFNVCTLRFEAWQRKLIAGVLLAAATAAGLAQGPPPTIAQAIDPPDKPGEVDRTPPEVISDLRVTSGEENAILIWTAPHEDGASGGPVTAYDIRYSRNPINDETSFLLATPVMAPLPSSPGTQQCANAAVDPCQPYYFAIRSIDDAWNLSAITFQSADSCGDPPGPQSCIEPWC